PKPAACIPCQDVKTMGPGPRLRLQALGAIVRNYQSPAMVNAGLPQANLAAGKVGSAGGWVARRAVPCPGYTATPGRDMAPALQHIVEETLCCVRGTRFPLPSRCIRRRN